MTKHFNNCAHDDVCPGNFRSPSRSVYCGPSLVLLFFTSSLIPSLFIPLNYIQLALLLLHILAFSQIYLLKSLIIKQPQSQLYASN